MKHPLLYEINIRCWLRELSAQRGQLVTLSDVPEEEFMRWQEWGFTHIWLMGVWKTGPRSRAEALRSPELLPTFRAALPDFGDDDVTGSPYAIAGYEVAPALGGEAALQRFRKRLAAHDLQLVLDFVPNHMGLDHPWVRDRPELFVQSPSHRLGTFEQQTAGGSVELAHGKDPFFAPWTDTVQLDYRRRDTRQAMLTALRSVARLCDGVRCDMAMLVLNEVFDKTWADFPSALAPEGEFWAKTIQAIKRRRRDFLFLGEVYWSLDAKLQSLGFDYTYDKRLYDLLIARQPAEIQQHLQDAPPGRVRASAHFLENHDEPRVASQLALPEHRAAALLVLGLPGCRLLHDGQLTGARVRTPVQLTRRPEEPVDPDIARLYVEVLAALRDTSVGSGESTLLRPRTAWADNPSAQNFILFQWQAQSPQFDLVVVNLAAQRSQCYAPLTIEGLSERNWSLRDLLGSERHVRRGLDMQEQGLYLDVPPYAAQIFHFHPTG